MKKKEIFSKKFSKKNFFRKISNFFFQKFCLFADFDEKNFFFFSEIAEKSGHAYGVPFICIQIILLKYVRMPHKKACMEHTLYVINEIP